MYMKSKLNNVFHVCNPKFSQKYIAATFSYDKKPAGTFSYPKNPEGTFSYPEKKAEGTFSYCRPHHYHSGYHLRISGEVVSIYRLDGHIHFICLFPQHKQPEGTFSYDKKPEGTFSY